MEPSHSKTPKRCVNEYQNRKTPVTTPKNLARFVLLSNNSAFSPSPHHPKIVRNPFENQIHERLHLPVISSPSLFESTTYQGLSPKFSWDIEELSNLNPVNVVPHESQFMQSFDEVREAQAQAAISSFFTEQIIVPSPQDCSLRHQKISFKDECIAIKIINSTEMASTELNTLKRDFSTQTVLSFPPKLPQEVEDVLRQFKLLNDVRDEQDEEHDEKEETLNDSQCNRSMMDISTLRRKLFINVNPESPEESSVELCDINLSPAPKTPQLVYTSCEEKSANINDSFGSDMFGELSPIQAVTPVSVNDVSMLSESCQETPAGRKEKRRGKNLSEFMNESFGLQEEEYKELDPPKRIFARFDSGFSAGENSNEFMQL